MKRSFFAGMGCGVLGLLLPLGVFLFWGQALYPRASALAGEASPPGGLMLGDMEEAEGGGGAKQAPSGKRKGGAMAPVAASPMASFGANAETLGGFAEESEVANAKPDEPSDTSEAAPSRAWFPETFLFEPLVVTDERGEAVVPVRVPDRLTRWRVLALAHSRTGAQAGAVTGFVGTLPTYVDPVLPPFLRAGDVVRLPVQVVNTTQAAVEAPLKLEATGAAVEGGARTVRVPARGSVVEYVVLRAAGPGPVAMRAALGTSDAVQKGFDVWPTGRPVVQSRGGTLAAPRSLNLTGPADSQSGSERVRLLVYPGALGVLRAELTGAGARGGVAEDAYTLLLAGRAPTLLEALGEKETALALKSLSSTSASAKARPVEGGGVDVESLKASLARASQRALRVGRAPEVATAALLAEGALAHPDNVVLARLGERLAAQVAAAQSPDGTCQGGDGWALQRLLVTTAECARAVSAASGTQEGKRRASLFNARASGALERNRAHVKDGYTAAVLVASGVVTGSLRDDLRKQVAAAVKKRPDGSAYLPVEEGVERSDGTSPSEVEATALAVLALEGDAKAPLADLGASLLAGYVPSVGWGDGRTNRAALQAAMALFREPLPAQVRVVLERDGQVVTEGTFDAKALRQVTALEAASAGSAGAHTWTVRAEPAVPGLGFSLSTSATVPWKAEAGNGLELAVKNPPEAKVGQPVEVLLQAATPSGLPLELRYGLPAGVQVDPVGLDAMVADGSVSSWDSEDGTVTLQLPAQDRSQPFQARFRVVPTLAGTLQSGASLLQVVGRPDLVSYVPPTTWAVR